MAWPPERIVCLTEETAETLYLLGEEDRIVGVTGYAVRPERIRAEKPRIAAFTSADIPKILALKPDLVLLFSDLQAEIGAELSRAGVQTHHFNQRDVAGIFDMVATLGALVGRPERAAALIESWRLRIGAMRAARPARRPLVWFEEWDEPLIAGIGWVGELIEIAGGRDLTDHLRNAHAARERIVPPDMIRDSRPDLILASWCGKKVRPARIAERPGWGLIPAVQNGLVREIKSPLVLAPGPAALTDGLDEIRAAVLAAAGEAESLLAEGGRDRQAG